MYLLTYLPTLDYQALTLTLALVARGFVVEWIRLRLEKMLNMVRSIKWSELAASKCHAKLAANLQIKSDSLLALACAYAIFSLAGRQCGHEPSTIRQEKKTYGQH